MKKIFIIFFCFTIIFKLSLSTTIAVNNYLSFSINNEIQNSTISLRFKNNENKEIKNIIYKEIHNKRLKLDIYYPEISVYNKYPVIVYLHGGSFISGDKSEIKKLSKYTKKIFNRGYAIISINYRLINKNTRFPQNIVDVKDAIRWIRKNAEKYQLASDKIGLWGVSAGANLALMTGLTDNNLFKGLESLSQYPTEVNFIISCAGPTNLPQISLFQKKNKRIIKLLGKFPGKQELKSISPIYYLNKKSPPILIIHGTKDEIVPYKQSLQFYHKANNKGVKCKLITIKGGTHSLDTFNNYKNINRVIEKTLHFINNNID